MNYHQRKDAGLCTACGRAPAKPGKTRCPICNDKANEKSKRWTLSHPEDAKQHQRDSRNKNYARNLWSATKRRAFKLGYAFNLDPSDIVIPDICPLLGLPIIKFGTGGPGPSPNSPAIDRIDPSRGYVKGNVWIISNRANTIKNDASPDELITIGMRLEELFG